jgi:hypothetical protein
MTSRVRTVVSAVALIVSAALTSAADGAGRRSTLPSRLSDREFWQLVVDASEPDGYFRSDNLTSNELGFQRVIPDLLARTGRGGVYLGVGPEQNFTYVAALHPAFAVIFDVRRGNLLVQLMYKALFELSRDRAELVSLLFARPRPPGLTAQSSAHDLFNAFGASPGDEALFRQTSTAIETRLLKAHALPLSTDDVEGIRRIYRTFFSRGFAIRPQPTYAELMTQTDNAGASRSFLASEANFTVLKDLEARNLVVPVVGDFAGPKAIRTIATYLKAHAATVAAFYLSNVEQYLDQDGKWSAFCKNVSALPLDASSTFIRSSSGRGIGFGIGFVSSLGAMQAETKNCGAF